MSKGPLLGLVLTAMAGWVDAIGFLRLGGFYPSFMSGNTTQLGIALATSICRRLRCRHCSSGSSWLACLLRLRSPTRQCVGVSPTVSCWRRWC